MDDLKNTFAYKYFEKDNSNHFAFMATKHDISALANKINATNNVMKNLISIKNRNLAV